jgi:hypothetical protein
MFWWILAAIGGFVHEKGLLPQTCRYCLEIVFHSNGFSLVMLILRVVPPWLSDFTGSICEDLGLYPSPMNHVLINEYLPGQGIMVPSSSCLIWWLFLFDASWLDSKCVFQMGRYSYVRAVKFVATSRWSSLFSSRINLISWISSRDALHSPPTVARK